MCATRKYIKAIGENAVENPCKEKDTTDGDSPVQTQEKAVKARKIKFTKTHCWTIQYIRIVPLTRIVPLLHLNASTAKFVDVS